MAVNGIITPTAFTRPARGAIIRRADLDALSAAVARLEGHAANVDNCGNCAPANCCQSCQSSVNCTQTCQSCQTTASVCQSCQSTACQRRQCQCNCSG